MESWHLESDFFALIIYLIMLIKLHLYKYKRERSDIDRSFSMVLVFGTVSVVIDIVSTLVMEMGTNWMLYEVSLMLYVMTMPLLAVGWLMYTVVLIYKEVSVSLLKRLALMWMPYLMYLVLVLLNPRTNWFFSLSEDLVYTRGTLYFPVGVGCALFYFILGIIIIFRCRKMIVPKTNGIMFLVFCAASIFALVIQIAHPVLLIIHSTYAVVFVLSYMLIEEQKQNRLYEQIRQQTDELQKALQDAENANDAKTRFLGRMSHDMRTPMNGILGLAELMRSKEDIGEIHKDLEQLLLTGKYLLNLINDTLDMSKIESGKFELKPRAIDSEQVFNNISANARMMAESKKVHLEIDAPRVSENNWIPVVADAQRLEQVLMNVISNAVKFTPEGGTIHVKLETISISANEVVDRYTISDNGIGISPDFLPHIFEPFAQETRLGEGTIYGTGLGLSIVKNLVELMGSEISVDSRLNEGTTVVLTMHYPVYRGTYRKELQKQEVDISVLEGRNVLLCEDNELNAEIAKTLLEKKGMCVDIAKDGREGVDLFQNSSLFYYGVILMDIRMPKMNGIEAGKKIRSLERRDAKSVPIIALTANAFEEDKEECLAAGMNEHLAKPVEPEELYKVLAEYIR